MNGAELPCGTILHVEPATDSTSTGKADTATTSTPPEPLEQKMATKEVSGTLTTLHLNDNHNIDDGDADDLDEFFDSL